MDEVEALLYDCEVDRCCGEASFGNGLDGIGAGAGELGKEETLSPPRMLPQASSSQELPAFTIGAALIAGAVPLLPPTKLWKSTGW